MGEACVKAVTEMAAIPRSAIGLFGGEAVSAACTVPVVELMGADSISAFAEQSVGLGFHGDIAESLKP